MNAVICCIAKCENCYIKEWVDYHLKLGFSHIYIYDNNNIDGERFEEVLSGYDDVVTVIDCRGRRAFQSIAYTNFYLEYGNQFDWIAYIDIDEFITFSVESGIKTIDEFLSRFGNEVDAIHLNWMCYGDNEIVNLDSYNVIDRFTKPLDYEKRIQYDFPENNHVKTILRCGLDIGNKKITAHTPKSLPLRTYDADGNACVNDYFHKYTFRTAYIRHYVTKTLPEWLLKIYKGNVVANAFSEIYPIERFFKYNKRTDDKDKIIKHFLFYKDVIEQSMVTTNDIYKQEAEYYKDLYEHTLKNYNRVINSKIYKFIKFLMK